MSNIKYFEEILKISKHINDLSAQIQRTYQTGPTKYCPFCSWHTPHDEDDNCLECAKRNVEMIQSIISHEECVERGDFRDEPRFGTNYCYD